MTAPAFAPPADASSLLPLTPVVCSILLALSDGEKHGYGIMQAVEAETGGSVAMGPGTLYGSLERMLRAKLLVESSGPTGEAPHRERRRYYRLTAFGQRVLRAEIQRLDQAVQVARRKMLTRGSRRLAS